MATVYIGGIYRSGTTFVQKFLDAQPTAHVLYQSLFPLLQLVDGRFRARRETGTGAGPMCFDDQSADPDLPRALELTDVTADDIRALAEDARRNAAIADDYPAGAFADALAIALRPGSAAAAAAAYFAAARAFHGATTQALVGFKEVFADPYLDSLLHSLPDLKAIHILRDPRAVLASRNYRDPRRGQSPQVHPLRMIAAMWANSATYGGAAAQRHPNRVLRLRFEDLMADKAATMGRILRFLDQPISESALDEGRFTTARGTGWNVNTSFADGPGHASQRWAAVLPPEAIGALEHLCRSRMTAEGYTPRFSVDEAAQLFAAYADPLANLKAWTRPYALTPGHGATAEG